MTLLDIDPRLDLAELEIRPQVAVDAEVNVLGSKSYTDRHLAIAGLSPEPTILTNALLSQDTKLLAKAVQSLGHVEVELDESGNQISVTPNGRPMLAPPGEIYLGNAGAGLRLLTTMAGLAHGRTVITGNARMQGRPMRDLLSALEPLGVPARARRHNGSPPIEVVGPTLAGGRTRVSGAVSSQFTSSLLVSAPQARRSVEVEVVDDLISKPYVDMTVAAMQRMGVTVERDGYASFSVEAGQTYRGGTISVEPDASGMSYFLAAAAVLHGRVRIPGIGIGSVQGDVGLVRVLVEMGCTADVDSTGVTLEGGDLSGVAVDMTDMPDVVPTLAVVAAYARGTTHITGIGSLRLKECDRIEAVRTELSKLGVTVWTTADSMTIEGSADRGRAEPHGTVIDTYDDHRIAMSFAIAGLRTPGVVIKDPGCVVKSFPTFWQALDALR